jgi:beta-mannosidase
MAQRNYPCDNLIQVYFGSVAHLNDTGEAAFKKQLYQCMIAQVGVCSLRCVASAQGVRAHALAVCVQGLVMKSDIETRRSQNQFGSIIWQVRARAMSRLLLLLLLRSAHRVSAVAVQRNLAHVRLACCGSGSLTGTGAWVRSGGWGSVEYGTPGPGQVIGGPHAQRARRRSALTVRDWSGRWKPLHYWLKNSLYTDVMATCGANAQCYVRVPGQLRTCTAPVHCV